jgi:hypothetical protein
MATPPSYAHLFAPPAMFGTPQPADPAAAATDAGGSSNNNNNAGWADDHEEVLAAVQNACIHSAEKHRVQYFHLQGFLKYFRIPSIILSAIASVASVGLQPYVPQHYVSLVTCMLSLLVGVINSLELYLQIQASMECELMSYKDYYMLANEISKTLVLRREHRVMDGSAYIEEKFGVFMKLMENAKPLRNRTRDPFRTNGDADTSVGMGITARDAAAATVELLAAAQGASSTRAARRRARRRAEDDEQLPGAATASSAAAPVPPHAPSPPVLHTAPVILKSTAPPAHARTTSLDDRSQSSSEGAVLAAPRATPGFAAQPNPRLLRRVGGTGAADSRTCTPPTSFVRDDIVAEDAAAAARMIAAIMGGGGGAQQQSLQRGHHSEQQPSPPASFEEARDLVAQEAAQLHAQRSLLPRPPAATAAANAANSANAANAAAARRSVIAAGATRLPQFSSSSPPPQSSPIISSSSSKMPSTLQETSPRRPRRTESADDVQRNADPFDGSWLGDAAARFFGATGGRRRRAAAAAPTPLPREPTDYVADMLGGDEAADEDEEDEEEEKEDGGDGDGGRGSEKKTNETM